MVSKAKKSEESHNGSTEQQTRKSIQKKRRWVVGKHHHQEWWQRNSGWKGERGLWLWHGWDVIWNIKILGEFCQVARWNPTFCLFGGLFGIVWGHQMSNSFRKTHQNSVISLIQLFCSKIQWCISLCLALCILQEVTNDPKHSLSLTQLLDCCFSLFSRLILRCFNSNSWHDGSNLLCEQVFSYYLTWCIVIVKVGHQYSWIQL